MPDPSEPAAYAETLYRAGLLERCLEFCARTAGQGEAAPKLLRLKAVCLIGLGRSGEARRILDDPLLDATADAAAQAELGAAFEARGENDDAMRRYDEALRLSPKDAEVLISRASLSQKLGRHAPALADLDAAILLEPAEAENRLLRLAFLLDAGRAVDAEREASVLMRERPELSGRAREILFYGAPIMRLRRAEAQWADGRGDEAVSACDAILAGDPKSAAALTLKGFCLMSAGKLEDARKSLEEAERLAPGAALPHKRLGMLLQRLGDAAGARASYDRALALDAADGETLFGRGEARLMQGDKLGALADFRAAAADGEWRPLAEQAIRELAP